MDQFNILDIIIAIPLIWGLVKGFQKGFILEIASLLGLIIGVYAGFEFSDLTNDYLKSNYDIDMPILAFAIVFIAVLIGLHFLGKLIEKLIKLIALGWLNKIAGAVFGLLKTGLILSVLLIFVEQLNQTFHFIDEDQKKDSLVYKPLESLAPTIMPNLERINLDPSIKDKLDILND